MSQSLLNQSQKEEKLKEIILKLHKGADVNEVKGEFEELLKGVDSQEIARLEQALINEGLPEEEIKRLCDVHVEVFREALNNQNEPEQVPGHPLHTFKMENRAIEQLITQDIKPLLTHLRKSNSVEEKRELLDLWHRKHQALQEIEKHYSREENLLFPYLERHGLSGPPSVMWSIHDDIRSDLKKIAAFIQSAETATQQQLHQTIEELVLPTLDKITDLIYRENKVLFQFSVEALTEDEWQSIKDESYEIGYTLIQPGQEWQAAMDKRESDLDQRGPSGSVNFDTGVLTASQIELIFNALPVDITFVDKDNIVRFFSKPKDRVFTRTKAVIGRKVELCHPPESVHVVEQIVEGFKSGRHDTAEFWLTLHGSFIHIRYFALRDNSGEYQGVLEVTQDVTHIRKLEREQRLLDWQD